MRDFLKIWVDLIHSEISANLKKSKIRIFCVFYLLSPIKNTTFALILVFWNFRISCVDIWVDLMCPLSSGHMSCKWSKWRLSMAKQVPNGVLWSNRLGPKLWRKWFSPEFGVPHTVGLARVGSGDYPPKSGESGFRQSLVPPTRSAWTQLKKITYS